MITQKFDSSILHQSTCKLTQCLLLEELQQYLIDNLIIYGFCILNFCERGIGKNLLNEKIRNCVNVGNYEEEEKRNTKLKKERIELKNTIFKKFEPLIHPEKLTKESEEILQKDFNIQRSSESSNFVNSIFLSIVNIHIICSLNINIIINNSNLIKLSKILFFYILSSSIKFGCKYANILATSIDGRKNIKSYCLASRFLTDYRNYSDMLTNNNSPNTNDTIYKCIINGIIHNMLNKNRSQNCMFDKAGIGNTTDIQMFRYIGDNNNNNNSDETLYNIMILKNPSYLPDECKHTRYSIGGKRIKKFTHNYTKRIK